MGKLLGSVLASMGVVGVLIAIALVVMSLCISVYGFILACKASIVLGIISLFVEPSPFVFGLCAWAFDINLPQLIMHAIHKG